MLNPISPGSSNVDLSAYAEKTDVAKYANGIRTIDIADLTSTTPSIVPTGRDDDVSGFRFTGTGTVGNEVKFAIAANDYRFYHIFADFSSIDGTTYISFFKSQATPALLEIYPGDRGIVYFDGTQLHHVSGNFRKLGNSRNGELRLQYRTGAYTLTEAILNGVSKITVYSSSSQSSDQKLVFQAPWTGTISAEYTGTGKLLIVKDNLSSATIRISEGQKKNIHFNGSCPFFLGEFNGMRLLRSTSQNTSSTASAWTFTSADIDTYGMFSTGSPTRFTIPSGISKIRIYTTFYGPYNAGYRNVNVRKNGGSTYVAYSSITSGDVCLLDSKVIDVVADDYFEVMLVSQNATTVYGTDSGEQFGWCMVEVIQ